MKLFLKVGLWVFLSVAMTACPGGGNFGSFMSGNDGRLPVEDRAEVRRNVDRSLAEVRVRASDPELAKSSSFNSLMNSNLLFHNLEQGDAESAAAVLTDRDQGFNFKCSERETDVQRYEKALLDFQQNAKLIGMILNMKGYAEIRKHEAGLKEIPVAVARNAFLNAYDDPSKDIILPPNSKEALGEVKKKYEKLQALKDQLANLTFDDLGVEDRREAALSALDEYEAIDVADDLDNLVSNGLEDSFRSSPVKNPLTEVRRLLTFRNQLDSGIAGVTVVRERVQQLRAEVARMETEVHGQYDNLIRTVYDRAGNTPGLDDKVRDFFSEDKENLMNRAIEATGWKFDVDQKYDLMVNSLDAKPEIDKQAIFSQMQTLSSVDGEKDKAYSKAVGFFENYSALERFKGNKFFSEIFGSQFAEIEDQLEFDEEAVGEVSSYRRFKSLLCNGKPSSCDVAEVLSGSYRDDDLYGRVFSALGDLAGADENSFENLEARLKAIEQARGMLVNQFQDCANAVANRELLDTIKTARKDYIKCDLLQGVLSTSGHSEICGAPAGASQVNRGLAEEPVAEQRATTIIDVSVPAE